MRPAITSKISEKESKQRQGHLQTNGGMKIIVALYHKRKSYAPITLSSGVATSDDSDRVWPSNGEKPSIFPPRTTRLTAAPCDEIENQEFHAVIQTELVDFHPPQLSSS